MTVTARMAGRDDVVRGGAVHQQYQPASRRARCRAKA